MRLAMESHTGGMPLCGLGAPETERVGATRSHDVEVGHTMGPPSERSHAASRNAITPRRSGLTTANRLRYPSSTEATPELFHGTRDTTQALAPVENHQQTARRIETAVDQRPQKRRQDFRVLRVRFHEAQEAFLPGQRDPEGNDHRRIGEGLSVQEQGHHVRTDRSRS